MDAIGGHNVKCNKPGSERQRPHASFHMWKINAKDKHIHKNKHNYIQAHM
jgi:hypothetical protein